MITSTSNPRIKALTRLKERSHRDASGLFPIEGFRAVTRAVQCEWPLVEAFIAPELAGADVETAARTLSGYGVPITELGADAFRKIAYRRNPDGVIAVGRARTASLADLNLSPNPLVLVAEGIEKPGNLGAMLRTADAAVVDALVVADPTTDPFNPNVVRASQGALFAVPVATAPPGDVAAWLRTLGVQVYAAGPEGGVPPWECNFAAGCAIVVGSEHDGLSAWWSDERTVTIPMAGISDSLNAATAVAVLLYEAVRQRR